MTKDNIGLPEYLTEMQTRACRLSGVLDALAHLDNEGACNDATTALIEVAAKLAGDLNNALDSVNIPAGEIQ